MAEPSFHSLELLGPFGAAPHLAVAVSGGADSMALALLAQVWAQAHGGHITALTVDHGLRPESRDEAEHVAAWMQARGIAHVILTPAFTEGSNNLQENARQRRYDALAAWCRAQDVLHCLVAHHAGDQRETIALMTARGETADGGAGMAAVRNYQGVRFLRPLLGTEKSALTAWLRAQGVDWIEDPSNQSTQFARVRMRQQLKSDAVQREALSVQGSGAGAARRARDEAQAATAAQMVNLHPLGFTELDITAWAALEPTRATQLMADILTTVSGQPHRPRGHETERLCAALRADAQRATLHGCDITRNGTRLRIARELARCEAPVMLNGCGQLVWDARFHVAYDLPAQRPLRLQPLGASGIKHSGLRHLPPSTPSVWHLDALLYVPYIEPSIGSLPEGAQLCIGFAPAKPLASAPFWWLN